MDKLRLIIADDERPARSFLKNILREFEQVELVGEAENGAEAVELIKEKKPDLALLDLQIRKSPGSKSSNCCAKISCRWSPLSPPMMSTPCRPLR
jgi:DNA-binding NarL/FixJ family response regulator